MPGTAQRAELLAAARVHPVRALRAAGDRHAPGMDDGPVKILEPRVPVAKWPHGGSALPVLVAITTGGGSGCCGTRSAATATRRGRSDAARVPGRRRRQRDRGPGRDVREGDGEDDAALDDLAATGASTSSAVMDPASAEPRSSADPAVGRLAGDDFRDVLGDRSPPASTSRRAAGSDRGGAAPVVQEAGAGAPGASADEGRRPSPTGGPSPRPRRRSTTRSTTRWTPAAS